MARIFLFLTPESSGTAGKFLAGTRGVQGVRVRLAPTSR